ncbi:non-ribosomal peptide synthetase [Streptomyces sp. 2231.1]|uniref:non-ribosomal peptide synthetase n=1 Tax=Streptomyces sp. 2231.1 TaxID=1855347 RepID=UPI00210E0D33|nr:non-ribosomal peptide synthetase [Streptomyces sp. 2231.1]
MVIQLAVEGTGSINAQALASAVAKASQSCPGSRLVRRSRTWIDSVVPARLVVLDATTFDRTDFTGLPALTAPLAVADGSPACEVLLLTGEPSTVIFRAAHAVMDLRGLTTWAVEVFRALRDEPLRAAAGTLTDYRLLADAGTPGRRPPLRLDQRSPLGGRAGTTAVWRRRTLPVRHAAVTARVSALLAEAVGSPARIMVPVDLRRHAGHVSSTANLTLPLLLHVPPGQEPGTIHRALLTALAERRELATGTEASLARAPLCAATAVLRLSRAASMARHRHLVSAVVSHAGRADPADYSTDSFIATTVYALPAHAPMVPFSAVMLELPGHTELVVSARGAADVGERCDALIGRIARTLTAGAPAPPRPSTGHAGRPAVTERILAAGPDRLPPLNQTVVQLLRTQSALSPQACAVTGASTHWSYEELEQRSDAVAVKLLAEGLRRGDIVGVLADRTAFGLAGIWGVLKAGAAFLPIDVRNPAQRVAELLHDAQVRYCLTEAAWSPLAQSADCTKIALEDTASASGTLDARARAALTAAAPRPADLAYVIYTSGSTGRPKGVQVEHRSLANAVGCLAPLMRCDTDTRAAYSFSPGFDLSLMQIFPPLLHGGAVVLVPGELDHLKLRDMFSGQYANTLSLTPTHLELATRAGIRPAGIRALQLGGENLTAATARRARTAFGPDCLIANIYGPTETTLACTATVVDDGITRASVPIGTPMHRTGVRVLDEHRREVPDGRLGELYVTGVQLARGYLNRPELTAERFVLLPDGSRAYRTGDLGLRLPDGQLEYAGRIDEQVKVRGHRVEPAEVEAALTELPGIAQAAVVARNRTDNVRALCAFVVVSPGNTAFDEAAIRSELARSLPPHLVPTVVRALPALPQTASGKTDRKALPDPFAIKASDDSLRTAALRTTAWGSAGQEADRATADYAVAAVTAGIWSRILRCEVAGLNALSDFHALGGDSLAVLEMLSALSDELLYASAEQQLLQRLGPLSDGLTLGRVVDAVVAVRSKS